MNLKKCSFHFNMEIYIVPEFLQKTGSQKVSVRLIVTAVQQWDKYMPILAITLQKWKTIHIFSVFKEIKEYSFYVVLRHQEY